MKRKSNARIFFLIIFLLFEGYLLFRFLSIFSIWNLIFFLLLSVLSALLFYLAYYDFIKLEVHNVISFIVMIFLLLLNIVLFKFDVSKDCIYISDLFVYDPLQNFLGALFLGSIFQLIVLLSKEKALGQGDVRIAIISGLLVGWNNLLVWAYITIFSALFYGLILGKERGKFKGLKIPFVPFMILGIILIIAWKI